MTPRADVVIAVHDPTRPIDRAVGSVLAATAAPVRVTVVVHNTEPAPILERLTRFADDPRLRTRQLRDGIPSPAGPFNAGLDAATADFRAVMGSDDELEPGAIDSWLAQADRQDARVVIARVRHAGGRPIPTPPTRPGRTTGLDPVRDRLSYRSAPLGLFAREPFGELRFPVGLPVGEDIPFVTRLWLSGEAIAYDRRGPAYVVHADAQSRTTTLIRPIDVEFQWLGALLGEQAFAQTTADRQSSVVVKLLRVHVFGAVLNRPDPASWTVADRRALAGIAARLVAAGHGIERVLSRRDRDLLDAILDPCVPVAVLLRAAVRRRRFGAPGTLVPRDLRRTLHREAGLRVAAASALQLL